jgi:UDP-N-acetylmuramyl pentapeptide phosphotransferase/UDP-N-acetylglucosamine-1-phosphate transferase
MGDAGSILLGFLAGALGLLGIARGLWPVWFPVLVFSPFIADASVTLIRRLFRGERIWEAHRSHYYQRLVQLGWGHRRTALVEYLLMAIVATLAVAGVGRSVAAQLAVVGVVVLLLTGSGIQVDRAWARHRIRTHAAD